MVDFHRPSHKIGKKALLIDSGLSGTSLVWSAVRQSTWSPCNKNYKETKYFALTTLQTRWCQIGLSLSVTLLNPT